MYGVKNFEQTQTRRFISYSGIVTKEGIDIGFFEDKGDGGAFTVCPKLEKEIKNNMKNHNLSEFEYVLWINSLLDNLKL